jgi:hypothetical protein
MTLAERVHEHHVRLGIKMGNCEGCKADTRPEWVRRAEANGLPVKDFTRA